MRLDLIILVILSLPISNAASWSSSSPAPKNIALVSIVENSTARAQVNRCTRVKLLLVGRENTEKRTCDKKSLFYCWSQINHSFQI